MGVRKNESMGFVDAVMVELGGPRSAALLEKLDAATPWERLAAPIRKLPEYRNARAHREVSTSLDQLLTEFMLLNHLFLLEREAEVPTSTIP